MLFRRPTLATAVGIGDPAVSAPHSTVGVEHRGQALWLRGGEVALFPDVVDDVKKAGAGGWAWRRLPRCIVALAILLELGPVGPAVVRREAPLRFPPRSPPLRSFDCRHTL